MDLDYAERVKECERCTAPDHDMQSDGYCTPCRLRRIDARFPQEFREWISNLTRLFLWRKAGYNLDSEPLSFEDWAALAEITRYYAVKDAEAAAKMLGAGLP